MIVKIHFYLFLFISYVFYIGKLNLFLIFYISILIHEIAHIVAALLIKVNVTELLLMPFGVCASYSENINSKKEMQELKHPYVGSEHLILALLKNKEIESICDKYDLSYDLFKRELINIIGKSNVETTTILHTPLLKSIINDAKRDAKENNNGTTLPFIFFRLAFSNKCIKLSCSSERHAFRSDKFFTANLSYNAGGLDNTQYKHGCCSCNL